MFTQNPKINTCHIFVLLHKSIFQGFSREVWLPRYTTLFFTCQGLLDTWALLAASERTISSPSMLLGTVSVGALLVSEQRRRSSSWCCNWMKCSCGWSLLNSASQLLEELESWTMRPAGFIWHFHSFWRINLREKLICSKLDGDRGHFPWKWRCSHFLMENRKASKGGK